MYVTVKCNFAVELLLSASHVASLTFLIYDLDIKFFLIDIDYLLAQYLIEHITN